MAEYFKEKGYRTAAFISHFLIKKEKKFHHGFDVFDNDSEKDHYGMPTRTASSITDSAIDWLSKETKGPFFLWLYYYDPHDPYIAPEGFRGNYNKTDKFSGDRRKDKLHDLSRAIPQEHKEFLISAYDEEIHFFDSQLGRFLNWLKGKGMFDNTIIILTSDHGEELDDNNHRWDHCQLLSEEELRVPIVVKMPKQRQGSVIENVVQTIDIFPTLIDLAGIDYSEPDKPFDGVTLKPLLFGEGDGWTDRQIFSHWNGRTSVRSQEYRLDHMGKLYDITNDPGQDQDISSDKPDILAQMMEAADKWKTGVLSELPDVDTRPFPVGHPDFIYTQLPARDGNANGNIQRSNRYPNCSFFTNWLSTEDSITWNVEVLESGDFEVELYYTCPENDIGSTVELTFGSDRIKYKINKAHNSLAAAQHRIHIGTKKIELVGVNFDIHRVPISVLLDTKDPIELYAACIYRRLAGKKKTALLRQFSFPPVDFIFA